MSANGAHVHRSPGQEMSEVAVVFNDQDTSAIKVSTKLQEVTGPLSASVITVTPQTPEGQVKQMEEKLPDMDGLAIIATEELIGPSGKGIWKKMLKAKLMGQKKNVVTVTYNFPGQLPTELQQYEVLDYTDSNFTEQLKTILEG